MTKQLSLLHIHRSIASTVKEQASSLKVDNDEHIKLKFHDAIQALETFPRPQTETSIQQLGGILFQAVHAAGDDIQKWKLLVLTILHRRYHFKAPEAKSIQKQNTNDKKTNANANANANATTTSQQKNSENGGGGHGERLLFYIIIIYLQNMAMHDKSNDFLGFACDCLGKLTLPAGGTRDVCAIIEHLTYDALVEFKIIEMFDNKESKTKCLVHGFKSLSRVENEQDEEQQQQYTRVLKHFIQCAAELLDKDLCLIRDATMDLTTSGKEQEQPPKKKAKILMTSQGEMQSTINTFVPHRDRGVGHRNLAQKVAELLIWSNTNVCKSDARFMKAFDSISEMKWDPLEKDSFLSHIHAMQTSIRRLRKTLNKSSREQGFSLCTSYQMDPSTIDFDMIRTGKEGDVQKLLRLATKQSDVRTIGLVSNRFTDPLKAVPMSSIADMKRNWIPLGNDKEDTEDVELKSLKLKCQEASIIATIKTLSERMKAPKDSDAPSGKIVVASIDGSYESDGGAILVAAAYRHQQSLKSTDPDLKSENNSLEINVQLRLGEKDYDVSDISKVMSLLDKIFTETPQVPINNPEDDAEITTTNDVQNLIDRHIQAGDILILFLSADIKLEQRVLERLGNEGSQIHCHITDEWSRRIAREDAKVGDITVTLIWDNECDLDLHAICPNGDHISYANERGGGDVGGGYLDVDMNAGGKDSMEPIENIFFGDAEKNIEAAHGKYKIFVQNYSYKGKTVKYGDPVPWRVRIVMDGKPTEYTGECIGSGSESDQTVLECEYSGRTAAAPEKVGTALESSNLIAVTSSTGTTLDALSGLMKLRNQHNELIQVRELVGLVEEVSETDGAETTLMAAQNSFNITNRDRLYLNLSRLPTSFHLQIDQTFQGGATLLEHTASYLAKRLIDDKINIQELKEAGYQDELVTLVQRKMASFGI